MRVRLIAAMLLLQAMTIYGQGYNRKDADSMLRALDKSKAGINRVDLLLNLAQFHIMKPGENKIDFDSATTYINAAAALNKTGQSPEAYGYQLFTESIMQKEQGHKDEARKMLEKAIAVLEPGSNKLYLGKAYFELAYYYNNYEEPDVLKRKDLVEQALHAFRQSGNLERVGASLTMLGNLCYLLRDYSRTILLVNEALAVYDSIKYERVQQVYILLGNSYRAKGDEAHALFYLLKALKIAQSFQENTVELCQINNNLGSLYNRMDNREMSIKYWSRSMEIAEKIKNELAILLAATNLSVAYNALGEHDRALKILGKISKSFMKDEDTFYKALYLTSYFRTYLNTEQYDKIQPYRDSLLRIAVDTVVDYESVGTCYRLLAAYYLQTKQYAKARQYLKENSEVMKNISYYKSGIIQGARLSYMVDSAEGNYRSAFNHLLFYTAKRDSVFNENRIKQLLVLGVEYETEMKEDSIKLKDKDISLLTQKSDLQQANLKQAGLIRNITIAGIIVAFIITGLIYRQYRHKQESSNRISQKNDQLQHLVQEKEWLLKEIHHRVKNNFQTVMGLLVTQAGYQKNDVAFDAITDSHRRIQSMSLIHQRLYQSNNLSAIDMRDYIHELVDTLSDGFNTDSHIRFNLEIEPIELDLAHCIPVGLILNEAITNSFKYAFPPDTEGIIAVSLQQESANRLLLTVKDNGTGLPASFNSKLSGSMGMNLMKGLSEEIGARFTIDNYHGTRIVVSFEYDPETTTEISQMKSNTISSL